ncbi:MAG: sugar-binding protein [Puniceicoccales bacterium]
MKRLLLLLVSVTLLEANPPEYTAYQLSPQSELTIDGDLSDWPDLPVLLLGKQDQVENGTWHGPSDSLAKIRMTWDEENLYFAIEVTDDTWVQNFQRNDAHRIHSQDSIQWAVDLQDDGGLNYGDDNYEYGFGIVDGEPLTYRWYSSSGWPPGIAEHVDLQTRPLPEGGTIYEAAVDWSMLAPLRNPEDGRRIGFNIVLQDRDEGDKKTISWTPGISSGKRPSSFGKLIFSTAAPSQTDSGILISANSMTGVNGLDLRIIGGESNDPEEKLFYQLVDAKNQKTAPTPLRHNDTAGYNWEASIPTRDLSPGDYQIIISDRDGSILGTHSFTRGDVERLEELLVEIPRQMESLSSLIETANQKGIQTKYPLSTLTAAKLFEDYIQEDFANEKFQLALHNANAIQQALDKAQGQLLSWIESPEEFPTLLTVPDYDYGDTQIDGRNLVIDGHPVLLAGPLSWLWGIHKNAAEIPDMGFNTFVVGWSAKHHFDKKGEMKDLKKIPYKTLYSIIDTARQKNVAMSLSIGVPEKVWRAIQPRGGLSMAEFHEIYDQYADLHLPMVKDRGIMNFNINTESVRAPAEYNTEELGTRWTDYLKESYENIGELNQLYETDYKSFAEVPFPESLPENAAQKYDYTRMRQIIIGEELTRAAETVRQFEPNAYIRGYPYVWALRDPAAYYQHAIDPVLDMESWDIAGCDTSGPLETERYAMATVNWMGGFYDLMRSIAGDRPLCDGEFHFANRRKIYPDNWARAIYFHAYIHGLSASYSWTWARGDLDASLLLDANILMGSGLASLDLQRTAPAITQFHSQPNDVVLLYSNSSSPHSSRDSNNLSLSQMSQTDRIYEGISFTGMQIGFLSENQIEDGQLANQRLLIVPNSSHVEKSTRKAIIDFASSGGQVILVGECLQYSPQGAPLPPIPDSPNITRLNGFADVDEARASLIPYLEQANVLPEIEVAVENGLPYPTVEWRRATDNGGTPLLFLLNLGHDSAEITLPDDWDQAVDLVAVESAPASFTLESLQFRLLRKTTPSQTP